MVETISIEVTGYNRTELGKTINTSFSEFAPPVPSQTANAAVPTVPEFFSNYSTLFYEIPKTGDSDSHEYLVKQSSEYIGGATLNGDIEALQAEITNLRQENLQLQQYINNL
jgi:hypothetical protein